MTDSLNRPYGDSDNLASELFDELIGEPTPAMPPPDEYDIAPRSSSWLIGKSATRRLNLPVAVGDFRVSRRYAVLVRRADRLDFLRQRFPAGVVLADGAQISVDELATWDPSSNAQYTQWLTQHASELSTSDEDKVRQWLYLFDAYKKAKLLSTDGNDLNRLDVGGLQTAVLAGHQAHGDKARTEVAEEQRRRDERRQQQLEERRQRIESNREVMESANPDFPHREYIGSDQGYTVYKLPMDREAIVKETEAAGGNWCVGYPGTDDHFNRYKRLPGAQFYLVEGPGGLSPWLLFTANNEVEFRDNTDATASKEVYDVVSGILETDLGNSNTQIQGDRERYLEVLGRVAEIWNKNGSSVARLDPARIPLSIYYAHPSLPVAEMEEALNDLSTQGGAKRSYLLGNSATPSRIVDQIGKMAIAGGLGTSMAAVTNSLYHQNASADLVAFAKDALQDHPEWSKGISRTMLAVALAASPHTTYEEFLKIIDMLQRSHDVFDVAVKGQNLSARKIDKLIELATDDFGLLKIAEKQPLTAQQTSDVLAKARSKSGIAFAVSNNRAASPESLEVILQQVAADLPLHMQQQILRHENVQADAIEKVYDVTGDDPENKQPMAASSVEIYARKSGVPIQQALSLLLKTTEGSRHSIQLLARSRELSDADVSFLQQEARNWDSKEEGDTSHTDRLNVGLLSNPTTPEATLRKLATEDLRQGNRYLTNSILTNPSMPQDVVDRFANSENDDVRMLVAKHPNKSFKADRKLARDPNEKVRLYALAYPPQVQKRRKAQYDDVMSPKPQPTPEEVLREVDAVEKFWGYPSREYDAIRSHLYKRIRERDAYKGPRFIKSGLFEGFDTQSQRGKELHPGTLDFIGNVKSYDELYGSLDGIGWSSDLDKLKIWLFDHKRLPFQKRQAQRDLLPGGLADDKTEADFDSKALEAGIKVEYEHTGNRALASEIARDHLTEDPKYYEKLARMERGDYNEPVNTAQTDGATGSAVIVLPITGEVAAQWPKFATDQGPPHFTVAYIDEAPTGQKFGDNTTTKTLHQIINEVADEIGPEQIELVPGVSWFTSDADSSKEVAHKRPTGPGSSWLADVARRLRSRLVEEGFTLGHASSGFKPHATLGFSEIRDSSVIPTVPEGRVKLDKLELWQRIESNGDIEQLSADSFRLEGVDSDHDLVVTLPKGRLADWVDEGDAAGEAPTGMYYAWHMGGRPPKHARPGNRVYVVHDGKLIGYAPLVRIEELPNGGYNLIRGGEAVACTIDAPCKGFRGVRYRWWPKHTERSYPGWRGPKIENRHAELVRNIAGPDASLRQLQGTASALSLLVNDGWSWNEAAVWTSKAVRKLSKSRLANMRLTSLDGCSDDRPTVDRAWAALQGPTLVASMNGPASCTRQALLRLMGIES